MGIRGRKSTASLSVAASTVVSLKQRPDPWPGLSKREVELWTTIVESQAVDWFSPGDLPLLVAYVKGIALHEQASRDLQKQSIVTVTAAGTEVMNPLIRIQDMAAKQIATMAVKLRLAQSSKWTEQKAATKVKHAGQSQNPWGA